ncbi:hypothetical protein HRbin36_00280 [bacterium HR36]|nr:hypothetical protein HRbin36_00280 [bacterium HR36]
MVQVRGQQEFAVSADILRQRLRTMEFLVRCIPDLVRVEHLEENQARLVVRPRLAFLRGEMRILLRREPAADEAAESWCLDIRGIGSSAQAWVTARVHACDDRTSRLDYEVTLQQVGGLLRAVHSALLEAAMQKTISDFLHLLQTALPVTGQTV